MNQIQINGAQVADMKQFFARGEQGIDVYVCDKHEYGTAHIQVTYYGAEAAEIMNMLKVGDLVDVSGTLRVLSYVGSDRVPKPSLVLANPSKIKKQNQYLKSKSNDDDDDLPF